MEHTPCGLVVTACSRFLPSCALDCTRECARRIDVHDRRCVEDRERVLVVYSGTETRLIAEALAGDLKNDGLTVELADADGTLPPAADYDAVVIGATVRLGRYVPSIIDYVREQRATLVSTPAFVFAVRKRPSSNADKSVARLTRTTGWYPTDVVVFTEPPCWPDVHDYARRIAEEVPAPLVQPSLL